MRPSVFDANVLNLFQSERFRDVEEHGHAAIAAARELGFIALDEDGHCMSEWIECAGGTHPLALKDWIADMLALEVIQLVPMTGETMFRELAGIGIPKKDHKWVRLARSSASNFIVTDDIDLFDPKRKKNCTLKMAQKIKESGSGPAAKHLRKKYGIKVVCPRKFPELAAA